MAQKTYNIYPSLLDRVQSYIDSDSLYEKFWGASDQPTKQLDQFRAEQRQAVLDMINRVPHAPIMAASCGTAFNELVDCLQEIRPSYMEGLKLGRDGETYTAALDGFQFRYSREFVDDAAAAYAGCVNQDFLEYTIDIDGNAVRLYGYADKWTPQHCIDLKTVCSYTWGKYGKGWQRYVYPLALRQSRGVIVESFRYDVFEWEGSLKADQLEGKVLNATYYCEEYPLDYAMLEATLADYLRYNVIPLLEVMRPEITNAKIFGDE